jgi:hypothetical protein
MKPNGCGPDEYNIWKGFEAEKLPSVPDDQIQALIEPIVRHIHEVIAVDNQEQTDFIIDYFANIVIRPTVKTHVALSLVGQEGCGKDILLDWIRLKILGKSITHQTDKLNNDLFDKFAECFINKVLIQADEVQNVYEFTDRLKHFITGDTQYCEKKNIQEREITENLCNLVLTSNNKNTIKIPPDDRRYCLFECSSKYKGNTQYFRNLSACMANPSVQRAFFQFLMSRDVSKYMPHFEDFRPLTKYYQDQQILCICPVMRFMSAIVNRGINEPIQAYTFYYMYTKFCDDNGFKFKKDNKHFSSELLDLKGVTRKKTNICFMYYLDIPVLREHMIKLRVYEDTVELA